MNPDNRVEVVAEADPHSFQAGADEAAQAGAMAVSHRTCELFEGGLGI